MYRRLARSNAGADLAAQAAFLTAAFLAKAALADDGDVNVQNQGYEGSSASFLYRGATAEERAEALDDALRQLEDEIAGTNRSAPGMLTPIFRSEYIPR